MSTAEPTMRNKGLNKAIYEGQVAPMFRNAPQWASVRRRLRLEPAPNGPFHVGRLDAHFDYAFNSMFAFLENSTKAERESE